MIFERLSERTGPLGGITADGMINVLGRPPFDTLTLVLREAVQNSWDARTTKLSAVADIPELHVRIRTLSAEQDAAFRALFSAQGSDDEPAATNELARCLASPSVVRVMEICDYATVGLAGPVDPREPIGDSAINFRNFFFDIGVAHPASGDGGTYGYGRSALYLAGRARTILVDTLALDPSGVSRRLMACRIGHAYEKRSFVGGGARYTGRHFWGRRHEDGIAPLTDNDAREVATSLGLPTRSQNQTGTTILIPWPDPEYTGRGVVEVLLHHLWPKMVSHDGPRAMRFQVEDEGVIVPVPRATVHPVYGLFASALLMARDRSGASGARELRLKSPAIVTGHLGLEVGSAPVAGPPVSRDTEDVWPPRSPFDGGARHVALMRPTELIVRYLEVPNARADSRPWAGAFVCSDDPDIQRIFAMAEPPAHDDWIPGRIEDVVERRLVNRTVNHLIPAAVRDAFGAARVMATSTSDAPSLAAASDSFSRQFLSGPAPRRGPAGQERRSVPSRRPRGARISGPWFEELVCQDGSRVARYRVCLTGVVDESVCIRARATIAVEGLRSDEDAPPDMARPEIICWRRSGDVIASNRADVEISRDGELTFEVAFRGDYAITVSCEIIK